MCGIVGYISNNDKLYTGAKDHFMRYALALDTLRGEDSTGLVTLSKRFTVKTLKTCMAGDVFVHSSEYKKKYRPGWAQIGHNRAATRGGISIKNAHPFTFGDVTMVHNGTLYAGGDSLETFDKTLGPVDSMQIAYALSQYPPDKADDVLEQIDGSFALVWTDRRDESINMARNADRPLHFTFNANKSILWYMSDGHHLHSINKSFGAHECRGQSVFEIDKSKILKYHKGCTKPEVIKFIPFVRVWPTQTPSAGKSKTTRTDMIDGAPVTARSALEKATSKWGKQIHKSASTTNSTDGSKAKTDSLDGRLSIIKVDLQGRKRRVPTCMQMALAKEMHLTPEDLMQFQPDDAEELPNGNYVVYGSVIHEEWDSMPWDMTLHNIPKIQYNAYNQQDWLVRPIGLCPSHTFDEKNSAVLGHLVHCDWDKYQAQQSNTEESSDDDKEEDSTSIDGYRTGDLLVPGCTGNMIPWRKLRNMLDAGCIHCGGDLLDPDLSDCLEVNNGMDLICGGCVKDLQLAQDENIH